MVYLKKVTKNLIIFLKIFKNKNIIFDTSRIIHQLKVLLEEILKKKKISSKLPSLKNIPDNKIKEKINFFINRTLKHTCCKKLIIIWSTMRMIL